MRGRALIAVAAAYALALHAIVLGMAVGVAALASPQTVHVLCAPEENGSELPAKGPVHLHADACCTSHVPAGPLPRPAAAPLPAGATGLATAAAPPSFVAELPRRPFVPVGSRAPPRLV